MVLFLASDQSAYVTGDRILAVGGAFTYFFLRARILLSLLKSVTKAGPVRSDLVPQRIKALIRDVLLQTSVRRKLGPGIAHSLIFGGFVVITIGTVEMMVSGVFRSITLDLLGASVRDASGSVQGRVRELAISPQEHPTRVSYLIVRTSRDERRLLLNDVRSCSPSIHAADLAARLVVPQLDTTDGISTS